MLNPWPYPLIFPGLAGEGLHAPTLTQHGSRPRSIRVMAHLPSPGCALSERPNGGAAANMLGGSPLWTLDNAITAKNRLGGIEPADSRQKAGQTNVIDALAVFRDNAGELFGSLSTSRLHSNPRIIPWRAQKPFRERPNACKSPEVDHSKLN